MSERKPPLGLSVEIETSNGTSYDLGPWSPATERPLEPAMGSQRGDGFADGSYSLARNIWRDYSDLSIYDTHRFVGVDGGIAYEGRLQSEPRSIGDDGHRIALQLQGWMSHGRDRPFQDIIVDRDLTHWRGLSVQRKLNLIAASFGPEADPQTAADATTGAPALETTFGDAWTGTTLPIGEGLYDGQGVPLGFLGHGWKKSSSVSSADSNFSWSCGLSTDDIFSIVDSSGELRAAGPASGFVNATASNRKFAYARFLYNAAGGAAGIRYSIFWLVLAVCGTHGLPKLTALDGSGAPAFAASDIIRYLAGRYAKKLSTGGVQSTTYPIPQAEWRDGADPYDAWVQLNDLHLWELNVFEGPTLHFHPADLSEPADWEIRAGEDGVKIRLDGDAAGPNGVIVKFTDYAGVQNTIYPTDYPGQLLDPSLENPATKHGIDAWGEPVEIPYPCDRAYAVQVGRAVLAQRLLPKAAGTITVPGHIRDGQGNWQQGWKPRCSDTVAIANAPNDRPRLITDARWDPVNELATLTVEQPSNRIEGLFNRTSTALRAANLGN